MAYSDWLSVNPTSGSGNGSVNVSTEEEHSGRTARETTITFKANNCEDVERKVIQAGKPEFVSVDSTTLAVDKEGGKVVISGTSNSSALSYALGTCDIEGLTLPDTYTANSVETGNGESIIADPGSSSAFPFSLTVDIPENDSTESRTVQVIFTDAAGNTATVTITQAANAPYLEITDPEGDIQLDYEGNVVSVTVHSNTNWTVE